MEGIRDGGDPRGRSQHGVKRLKEDDYKHSGCVTFQQ